MSQFANDTFTDSPGVSLASHIADSGEAWTLHPASSGNTAVISDLGRLRANASSLNILYTYPGTPNTRDYRTNADLRAVGSTFANVFVGITARHDVAADTCYVGFYSNGVWRLGKRIAGVFTQIGSTTAVLLTQNTTYQLELSVTGASPATLTFRVNGTTVCSGTDSDISSTGKAGVYFNVPSPSDSNNVHLDNYTATNLVATGYTLTGPSGGVVGVASGNFTVTPNGPYTGTITPASSGSGTFSPTSLSWSAASDAKTFVYTPASTAGSPHSISATSSPALTNPASVAYAVTNTPATIAVNDANLFFSPYNWRLSGSSFAQTNNPGAYLKARFGGTSFRLNVSVSMLAAASVAAGEYPVIAYSVDGGAFTRVKLTSSTTQVVIASGLANTTHTVEVHFVAGSSDYDRWSTPSYVLRVTGLEIDSGNSLSAPALFSKRAVLFGDSNSEGVENIGNGVSVDNQDALQTAAALIGRALEAEYGIVAFAGQGWQDTGQGGVPTLANAWNLYSAGQSRLVSSLFTPVPDFIVSLHGQNDAGASDATVTAAVTAQIAAWRSAAASAKILVCVPCGLQKSSAIAAGVTAAADANCLLLNHGENLLSGSYQEPDGFHMLTRGHARYAAALIGKLSLSAGTFPTASQVLSGVVFGPSANLTGTVVLPSTSDVRTGITFGAASGSTGTCAVPTASQVLVGVAVNATTGNVVLPSVGDVRSGTTYGASSGLTGTLSVSGGTYTAASNVRFGTDRGDGVLGTLRVPFVNQVLQGVLVDASAGVVVLPSVGNVRKDVLYGGLPSAVGTLVLPSASQVQSGVGFGASGTEFVGTLSGGSGSGDATLANQQLILAKLNAIKGSGDTTWTIAVRTAGDVPIAGCDCWITTDQAGLDAITDIQRTDANGIVKFLLDPGTYYLFRRKTGVTFTNPQAFTVN